MKRYSAIRRNVKEKFPAVSMGSKPATPQQARIVLLRKTSVRTPYEALMVEVIVRAITDATIKSTSREEIAARNDALQFFKDGRSRTFAELAGINPDFVIEVAHKCGVFSTEAQKKKPASSVQ